jgi:hypothetical protein
MRAVAHAIGQQALSRYSADDSYPDPVTGVLKNRLGIADDDTLVQAEADIVATRS